MAQAAEPLYRGAARVAGVYAMAGTVFLRFYQPAHALAFAVISMAGWLCLEFWLRAGRRGVPALVVLAVTLNFLNTQPLLSNDETLQGLGSDTLQTSALTVALFGRTLLLLISRTIFLFCNVYALFLHITNRSHSPLFAMDFVVLIKTSL